MIEVISYGTAKCKKEPMGKGGMEGFNLGDEYKYEICRRNENHPYYRVYPSTENDITADPEYYEVCGEYTFKTHFEVINQ